MKEITLKIPDNNFPFFMQLMQQLGYVKIDEEVKTVPEHHKKIIRERLKTISKEKLLDWDKVKDDFITE